MSQSIRRRTAREVLWHQHAIWRPPVCVHEARRSFTVSFQKHNVRGMRRKQEAMASANSGRPAQAHPKIQAKLAAKDMTADQIPDDVGLVPGTFVMPTGPRRPSILEDPLLLSRLLFMKTRTTISDVASRFVYKWFFWRKVAKDVKPARPQINRRTIVPKAKELHKRLYTALARGDEDALKDIACKTLLAQYKIRIARRKPDESVHWRLVKYTGIPPRIVSHKGGAMGMDFGGLPLGIQQAIVKIRSIQQMKTVVGDRRVDRLGRPIAQDEAATANEEDIDWSDAKEKSVTEYIVIQRRLLKGVPEDWRVWGFAKEFDVAILKAEDKAARELEAAKETGTEKRVDVEKVNKPKGIASAYS